MINDELDLEQIDKLAREFWQDDLAKFFPKKKEPAYTEYRMFQAGYQKALEYQEVDKVKKLETDNSVLRSTLKQAKETLKDILAFIEAMEKHKSFRSHECGCDFEDEEDLE